MKTVAWLLEAFFRSAAACKLPGSNNDFSASAIAYYFKKPRSYAITERLNELYSISPAKLDLQLHLAQMESLKKTS